LQLEVDNAGDVLSIDSLLCLSVHKWTSPQLGSL